MRGTTLGHSYATSKQPAISAQLLGAQSESFANRGPQSDKLRTMPPFYCIFLTFIYYLLGYEEGTRDLERMGVHTSIFEAYPHT